MGLNINPGAWLIQPAVVISIVLSIFIFQKQRKIEREDLNQRSNTPSILAQPNTYNNQVPKNLGGFIVKCVGLVIMSLITFNNAILERYDFLLLFYNP